MTTPSSPASTLHNQTLQALHHAQKVADRWMVGYLVGGGVLGAAGLVSVAYSDQLPAVWAWLPYVAMAVAVLWFGCGALVVRHFEQRVKRCSQAFDAALLRKLTAPFDHLPPLHATDCLRANAPALRAVAPSCPPPPAPRQTPNTATETAPWMATAAPHNPQWPTPAAGPEAAQAIAKAAYTAQRALAAPASAPVSLFGASVYGTSRRHTSH